MNRPLVSVVMPSIRNGKLLENALTYFHQQDYENKELILIADELDTMGQYLMPKLENKSKWYLYFVKEGTNIGYKRNYGCDKANGSIIVCMDDDDFYAQDWISKSVEHLQRTGADITGLSSCYFYQPNQNLYLYNYPTAFSNKPYVVGASMCYRKSFWEKHPFQDRQLSEDLAFLQECDNISAHDYINGFVAILHGNNTSSHLAVGTPEFTQLPIERIREIMGSDLERYTDM